MKVFIISAILAVISCQAVFGVEQCYQCFAETKCSQPTPAKCKVYDTDSKTYFCQTYAYKSDGKTVVSKGCIENTKENKDRCEGLKSCEACETDLCNVGDVPDPGNGAAGISVFFAGVFGTLLISRIL